MAYIKLRQKQIAEARSILHHLTRLDREDRAGASILRSMTDTLAAEPRHD